MTIPAKAAGYDHRAMLEKLARVFADQYDITLTFGGSQSYTDGKRINLHAQPCEMTQEAAEIQLDLAHHELGHVMFEDCKVPCGGPDAWKKASGGHDVLTDPMMKTLHNIVSDGWTEQEMMLRYPGISYLRLNDWICQLNKKSGKLAQYQDQVFLALLMLLKGQRPLADTYLDPKLVEMMSQIFKEEIEATKPGNCKSTWDSLAIAKKVREKLKKLALEKKWEPEKKEPKPKKAEKKQPKEATESLFGGDEDGEPNEEDTAEGEAEGTSDAELGDSGSKKEPKGEKSPEPKGDKSPEPKEPKEPTEEDVEGDSDGESFEAVESDELGGAAGEYVAPKDELTVQKIAEALAKLEKTSVKLNATLDATEAVDTLMNRGGDTNKMKDGSLLPISQMCNEVSSLDTYETVKTSSEDRYQLYWSAVQKAVNHSLVQVTAMTQAKSKDRVGGFDQAGRRLNLKRIAAVKYERHPNIFQTIVQGEDTNAAFSLLLDESGSMMGDKIENAKKMMVAWGEMLNRLHVPFEMLGFSPSNGRRLEAPPTGFEVGWFKRNTRQVGLRFNQYITFGEKWSKRKSAVVNARATNGTPLHWAMLETALRLSRRPEPRRVMVVVTDGQAGDTEYTNERPGGWATKACEEVVEMLERKGILVLVIGIGVDIPWKVKHKLEIGNSNELAAKLTKFVVEFWREKVLLDSRRWTK